MYHNFANQTDIFIRSLARRAFMQFSSDQTPVMSFDDRAKPNVTIVEASRLLSAVLFIDVCGNESRVWLSCHSVKRSLRKNQVTRNLTWHG